MYQLVNRYINLCIIIPSWTQKNMLFCLEGKTVGSVPFKRLIILCHQNLQKIHGLYVPQPYCLQTSATSNNPSLLKDSLLMTLSFPLFP